MDENYVDGSLHREYPDSRLDDEFVNFRNGVEETMAAGGLHNPFVIVQSYKNNVGIERSYMEIHNAHNIDTERIAIGLMRIGANLADNESVPFMIMFAAPGHAERYNIGDLSRLKEIADDIESRMKKGDVVDDTTMTALLFVDGRRRGTVSFYVEPADGGKMVDRRFPVDKHTGFMVGSGVDVFELCKAVFVGAAEALRKRDGDDSENDDDGEED